MSDEGPSAAAPASAETRGEGPSPAARDDRAAAATLGCLDRYVLRRMTGVYGVCLISFLSVFLVVDGFSRMDEFLSSRSAIEAQGLSVVGVVLEFYATKLPRFVSLVGPYITLFAGIATLLSFARTNEIVPMLSAGRSIHRVLLPVYAFAAVVAGTLAVFEDRVVPESVRRNEILDRLVRDEGRIEISKVPHLTDGENRIVVARWYPREQRLSDVRCARFRDPSGELPLGSLQVRELYYRRNPETRQVGWFPRDGTLAPLLPDAEGRIRPEIRLPIDRPLPLSLTPERIGVLAAHGEEAIDTRHLEELRRAHPHQPQWAVDLHTRTARPVASFVLLLLGIPFVASPEKRSVAWGLGLALGVCVAYFGVDFACRELAMRGALNPVLLVWTPPILFTAVALAMMDRVVT